MRDSLQADMPGKGRTFRRKTAKFWSIWPLPPKVEEVHDVVYLDGIYLARNLCVLICCNDTHVLGWYVCRYEHARAWQCLMERIAEPKVVVSDGANGLPKALRKVWPQMCIRDRWKLGFFASVINLIIFMGLGSVWMKLIGMW